MKSFAIVSLAALLGVLSTAVSADSIGRHHLRDTSLHSRIARSNLTRRADGGAPSLRLNKRCKPKGAKSTVKPSSTKAPGNPAPTPKDPPKNDPPKNDPPKNDPPKNDPPKNNPAPPPPQSGVIKVNPTTCKDIGASKKTIGDAGPNGSLAWLNCGIHNGGWNPSHVGVKDLIYKDLGEVLSNPNSPYHACAAYTDLFYQFGGEFGIPAIMIAAFAMQESSCRKDIVGGGGEQGLMQITRDKCGGRSDEACRDPWYNIRTGAKYFADTLRSFNGNVLLAIGQYNGWVKGLTYERATAARYSDCCPCQNNLDYLHQFLNGWLQGLNGHQSNPRLGVYFNLDVCHK